MASNSTSKHAILSQWIKDNIEHGKFQVGDKIPSENELASMFSISRQTVRHSIGTLEAEGYLIREQGSGTYVNHRNESTNNKKNMCIGVITTYLNDYIFPGIIHGIEEVLTEHGFTLSLGITYNRPSNEENCLNQMLAQGVDGLIIEGTKSALPTINRKLFQSLKKKNIPIIFINSYYEEYSDSYVILDDITASKKITELLIQNGHSRIGGIFKSDDIQGIRRYEGLMQAANEYDIIIDETSILWYTTEDLQFYFHGALDSMITTRMANVTGVVCYNDEIAASFMKLLTRNDISVPEDISLVSFDNSLLSKQVACNLTSVIYPAKDVGSKAASLLLKKLSNPFYTEKIELEPIIQERNSIKKIQ